MNNQNITITVNTLHGIRGNRLAQDIQACAYGYKGSVFLIKNERRINVNSLVGILSLAITNGDVVDILCIGDDDNANAVIEKIRNVLCG